MLLDGVCIIWGDGREDMGSNLYSVLLVLAGKR